MPHRILIVDDHRDVVRLLQSALDSLEHEFEIVEAPSGEEAFLEISLGKIDLAIIDYVLPGISGLELMAKIATFSPDAKIILISGSKEKRIRTGLQNAGAFAFFEKPLSLTDFLDAVERSLDVKRTIHPEEEIYGDVNAHKNISGLLSKFRKNMNADVILLLSDQGLVLARAGGFQDSSLEVSVLSSLMGIFRASLKVSEYIHQETPLSYHIFPGGDQDVLLVPVNNSHAMILAGDELSKRKATIDLIDGMMILKSEVEHILDALGIGHTSPAIEEFVDDIVEVEEKIVTEEEKPEAKAATEEAQEEEAEDVPEELIEDKITSDELDILFQQKTTVKTDDAMSFWDDAENVKQAPQADSDQLTYEQALQLGLTPDDDA